MSLEELVDHFAKINQCKGKIEVIDNIALPAMERIKTRMNEQFDKSESVLNDLHEHMKSQDLSLEQANLLYKQQMAQRDQDANQFVLNKSNEELKTWLAKQPVAYDSWKDASHDVLVELVLNVYDE